MTAVAVVVGPQTESSGFVLSIGDSCHWEIHAPTSTGWHEIRTKKRSRNPHDSLRRGAGLQILRK